MAGRKAGGGRSRMDLRRQSDAAEAREGGAEVEEVEADDEEEDEDEDDEADADGEEVAEEEAGADDDAGDDDGDDDDEDGPKKKKKKAKVKAPPKVKVKKAPAKRKPKAVKEVRQRAIWVVFDNASKRVGTFPYPQKKEAEELMAAKMEEKKTTFFIQLIKEPIEV